MPKLAPIRSSVAAAGAVEIPPKGHGLKGLLHAAERGGKELKEPANIAVRILAVGAGQLVQYVQKEAHREITTLSGLVTAFWSAVRTMLAFCQAAPSVLISRM